MNVSQTEKMSFLKPYNILKTRKDVIYLFVFGLALLAFETFNYSTTEYALFDLLGDLNFSGIPWATLLAIAFCGIDFAGIAILLAPIPSKQDNRSSWFMFGAWILAATMNAILTWWGVVLALQSHLAASTRVVDSRFVTHSLPVFIALMVWLIRILLIGSLTKTDDQRTETKAHTSVPVMSRRELRQAQSRAAHPAQNISHGMPSGVRSVSFNQSSKAKHSYKPEPTYIPMQDEAIFFNQR